MPPFPGQPEHRNVALAPWLDLCVMQLESKLDAAGVLQPFLVGPVRALPLGDSDAMETGQPVWVLGYGQQQPAKPTRHTCPGAYAGRDPDEPKPLTPNGPPPAPSEFLAVTADMLGGHSGGPAVAVQGGRRVVVGWSICSFASNGETSGGLHGVRPVNLAKSMLKDLTAWKP